MISEHSGSPALLLGALLLLHGTAAQAAGRGPTRVMPAPSGHLTGLAFDRERLWASDHYDDKLYRIDPGSGRVLETLDSPGYRPMGLAWDGEQLWVADLNDGKLYRMDTGTKLCTRQIDASVPEPRGLAWDGEHLWISRSRGKELLALDPSDGTTVRSIPAPSAEVTELTFDGQHLWATDRKADEIYLIDPSRGEVLASLPAPGPHVTGAAYAEGQIFIADYQRDRIYVLPTRHDLLLPDEDERVEKVELIHLLRNHGPGTLETLDVYLAVPRDLPNQTLLAPPEFDPEPAERLKDQWGQDVTRFHFSGLDAGAKVDVRMRVRARIRAVRYFVLPDAVGRSSDIPTEIRHSYLADDSKFDLDNPIIRQAVKEAVAGEKNPYWIVRRIARHIQDRLHYELAGGWNVAPRVYERGSGSCSEYTFVFLAMCRAAGVPARYAGALVIRGDDASTDDTFHRWAEVYLPKVGWIPYDVQAGDKEWEAERGRAFGRLDDRFLITTHGGGNSRFLGWSYNYDHSFQCRGRCRVDMETFAEWEPVDVPDR